MEKVVTKKIEQQIDRAYWRGKRVLITGHTGFKGGWLTIWLNRMGCNVTGLSLAPATQPALFELAHISGLCENYFCDIRDAYNLKSIFDQSRPEIVFHLAAQALVRESYIDPLETFSTNTMGTANVLEAIRHSSCAKAAVMITTDKVYRNLERLEPYKEQDGLGGHDPYSASKAASELIIDSYRKSYMTAQGINVASARAGNVIGGGDWATDRLIPDAIRAWCNKRSLDLRNPDSIRPWQHVLEPLRAYIILAQQLATNNQSACAYNFGPDFEEAASVRQVIELAQRTWGDHSAVHWGQSELGMHEAGILRLDTYKSQNELGIRQVWSIDQAVERTVEWYKKQNQGSDALYLCDCDIHSFESLALNQQCGDLVQIDKDRI
jgi:CDP-glucose 4,6-dehydratase